MNFVLNAFFIPMYGALGAVIGTVGAQFGELTYQVLKTRKELPIFYNTVGGVLGGLLYYVAMKVRKRL